MVIIEIINYNTTIYLSVLYNMFYKTSEMLTIAQIHSLALVQFIWEINFYLGNQLLPEQSTFIWEIDFYSKFSCNFRQIFEFFKNFFPLYQINF